MNAEFLPERSYFISGISKSTQTTTLPEIDTKISINLMGAKIG